MINSNKLKYKINSSFYFRWKQNKMKLESTSVPPIKQEMPDNFEKAKFSWTSQKKEWERQQANQT